jgi:hypothetical protein
MDVVYRFSDCDGVRSGKSGWSFGVSQFDINNNPAATLCLRECGFTTDEIQALKLQVCLIGPANAKLHRHSTIVDEWDQRQINECLDYPARLCKESGIRLACNETIFHIADYHNQFYMSKGGKLHRYLSALPYPVAQEDIKGFKLTTAWGKKRPDDVERRYRNIARLAKDMEI